MKNVTWVPSLLALIALSTTAFSGEVYKRVGPDGSVTYSDRQIENGQFDKQLKLSPSNSGSIVLTPKEKTDMEKRRAAWLAEKTAKDNEEWDKFHRAETQMLEYIAHLTKQRETLGELASSSGPLGDAARRTVQNLSSEIKQTEKELRAVRQHIAGMPAPLRQTDNSSR